MKSIKTVIVGILIITLNSCSDFLDIEPETSLTSDGFYQTKDDYEQAVGAVYAPLQELYEIDWMITEMRSDNTSFAYNVAQRGPKPDEDLATFTVETNNRNLASNWSSNYQIISRANGVLNDINDANFDQAIVDNLKGQALFLRAFAYYDLVKNFGGVPLFLGPPTSYAETFKPRSAVEDIYNQIISDSEEAVDLLPSRGDQNSGRVTSAAATTLLGDVFITLERWSDAETVLEPITNSNYGLLPDYADIFRPSNEGNEEIIFDVEYLEGTSKGLASTFPYAFLPEISDPSVITGVEPASQNNEGSFNVPTPDLIMAYEDTVNDERYSASLGFYTGPSPIEGITYDDMPYIRKYQHPHAQFGETDQNWPVYRYAEVLLMLAEAINEQGARQPEAEVYLNQVRNRAGLDDATASSQSELRDIILHERRIELAFENKRWHDLVRTGRAVEVMSAYGGKVKDNPQEYYYPPGSGPVGDSYNINEDLTIYPIPVTEINTNPDLEQNPGY